MSEISRSLVRNVFEAAIQRDGITCTELCRRAGISQSTGCRIINEKIDADIDNLARIAIYANVPLSRFIKPDEAILAVDKDEAVIETIVGLIYRDDSIPLERKAGFADLMRAAYTGFLKVQNANTGGNGLE